MSYRDWLVGGMMREYFRYHASQEDKFAHALLNGDDIRQAVLFAHRIADSVIEERHK